jgi:hypothetical protein
MKKLNKYAMIPIEIVSNLKIFLIKSPTKYKNKKRKNPKNKSNKFISCNESFFVKLINVLPIIK